MVTLPISTRPFGVLGVALVIVISLYTSHALGSESEELAMPRTKQQGLSLKKKDSAPVLSETAEEGRAFLSSCNACHNPALKPAIAPPMFGVQKRYNREYTSKENFIEAIVSFVQEPTKEKALMKHAVNKMGVMPKGVVGLSEIELEKLATYLYEERFAYPCEHWQNTVDAAEKAGLIDSHIDKDKKMIEKYCAP